MGSEGSQVELREQEVDEEGRRSEKDRSEGRWSEEGRGEEGEGSVNSTRIGDAGARQPNGRI